MTSAEFVDWAMRQPSGRYELVDGEVVAMSPERSGHNRVKGNVFAVLRAAIKAAALPCQAFTDGMAVEIDGRHTYEPDAMIRCGEPLDDDAVVARDPVILVEVVSPSSAGTDAGKKLVDYFRLPSVRHYLIVDPGRRTVVHHARGEDGAIATRIVPGGTIRLDPPGIGVATEDFFAPA
jgi:Uma2 family endonuclease